MRKGILMAALLAAVFAGWSRLFTRSRSDPAHPKVTVTGDEISVKPEPLRFRKEQRDVLIVWQLPKDSAFRFADDGIVIDGEITEPVIGAASAEEAYQRGEGKDGGVLDPDQTEIVDCRVREGGLEFTCLNRHTRPGIYKYTVRVLDQGKPLEPYDPTVMND